MFRVQLNVKTLYCMLTYCVSGVVKEELISLNVWERLSEVESKCYPAQV